MRFGATLWQRMVVPVFGRKVYNDDGTFFGYQYRGELYRWSILR